MALSQQQQEQRLLLGHQGFYFTGGESIRVTSFNSITGITITGTGRFLPVSELRPTDIAFPHTPNTDRSAASSDQVMGEGWLQSLTIIASSGSPVLGSTFVRVDVVRGSGASSTVLATLLQGFVTAGSRLAWPGSLLVGALGGPGRIRLITGSDPAAGLEILETVPTGARWRLLSMRATLVADATAANRQPAIRFDDGGALDVLRAASGTSQTASTTWVYHWGEYGATGNPISSANVISIPSIVLLAGWRIRTGTSNIQAGDDWGAPALLVEEWIDG